MIEDREQTKGHILVCAIELFAKVGYDGMRMDQLAKDAKLNKATIYYHYTNKQTLYETIITLVSRTVYENIQNALQKQTSEQEQIISFIDMTLLMIQDHRGVAKIMMMELSQGWKNVDQSVRKNFIPFIVLLAQILEMGVQKGVFNKINPILFQAMLVGGFNYYLQMKELVTRFDTDKALAFELGDGREEIKTMILKSLLKRGEDENS